MPDGCIAGAGAHFLIGLRPAPYLHEADAALLSELRPAGVILYKSNFLHDVSYPEWLETHAALIAAIHAAAGREKMFIAIDHEGGRVCRTPPPITRFAYAACWAASAASVGEAMGRELASLGVNLNFAPVLDIHTNPANPVIGERAFGSDAESVSSASLAFLQAMEAQGVLGCGKHFPGHGDTNVDSHIGLPSQTISLDELRGREFKPFASAIGAGIHMLMTAHIMFPRIDPAWPATLSKILTTDVLRKELGFNGVIVSDDIGMGAMETFFSAPEAAARLIESGTDMLMVCAHFTSPDRARGFAKALLLAVDEGRLDPEVLQQSRQRIDALLARARTSKVSALPSEDFVRHAKAGALFEAQTVEVI